MKEGIEKVTKKMESSKREDGALKVKEGESKTNDKDLKTKCKDMKTTEPPKKKGKEFKPPTKVVVRRLPPSMTEEEFLQQIDPLPPVDFMYYVQADNSLSPNNFCRAYLNFVNQADIFIFTQKFDNYVFVDSKGIEYPAVVEFAPFQRIPKQRQNKKKDTKSGTLASDSFYISFLEKLETEAQEMTSANNNAKQHFFETNVDANEVTKVSSTPLLDFLHNKYQERRRVKEEKRKKDIERKKAKDEIKKAAKKDDEATSAVKVLHGNAASKDKLKDKENSRPTVNKKRNDERVKENKIRVGKSYQEEKQKQLEKREEQKRKMGLSKSQKSSNDDKKEEGLSTKDNEDNDGEDGDHGNGSNETEQVQEDKKDTISSEKSTTSQKKQYTSGQAYQEYQEAQRAKRDEERRRYREERALKRKEERLRSKKAAGAEKKNYDSNGRYKERSGSGSFKGPPSNSYAMDKKAKNSRISRSEDAADGKKQNEEDTESSKADYRTRNESFGEVIDKSCKNNIAPNKDNECKSSSRLDSGDSHNTPKLCNKIAESHTNGKDVKEKGDCNREVSSRSDLNSVNCGRVGTFDADDVADSNINNKNAITASLEENENDEGIYKDSSKKSKLNRVTSSINRDDDDDDDGEINSDSLSEVKSLGESNETAAISCNEDTTIKNEAELGNQIHEKISDFLLNEDKKEECIKRRNSMEMYTDGKEENGEKHKRRESGRRNSLESGDQNVSLKSLGERRDQEKESGDSKERLKDHGEDPRTKRRIRNKDRPSMEIYRPGMGRFSKQRLERDKVGSSTEVDSPSPSPSPTPIPKLRHSNSNSSSQGRAA